MGNDPEADGRRLVMIIGANQGGKSTFLRSLGMAQLLMHGLTFEDPDGFRVVLVPERWKG